MVDESTGGVAQVSESVYYNCVCDEAVPLYCGNRGCSNQIVPDSTMVVTPEGSVYCSEACAGRSAETALRS